MCWAIVAILWILGMIPTADALYANDSFVGVGFGVPLLVLLLWPVAVVAYFAYIAAALAKEIWGNV